MSGAPRSIFRESSPCHPNIKPSSDWPNGSTLAELTVNYLDIRFTSRYGSGSGAGRCFGSSPRPVTAAGRQPFAN